MVRSFRGGHRLDGVKDAGEHAPVVVLSRRVATIVPRVGGTV